MDLIEFCFASGIIGFLARMSHDIHKIRGAFTMIEETLEKFKVQLGEHEKRISNLEQKGKGEHERLAKETL